jgi:hypothetical protein
VTLDPSIERVAGRRERRAYLREYHRKWRKRPENLERLREEMRVAARNAGKARYPAKKKWRENNPRAVRAHGLVNKALMRGKLKRPDKCQRCGKKCKPHAHHEDYEKPLEVIWLCAPCHKIHHEEKRCRLQKKI